jgi:tetratricopeptide (TPR) repeat protein
LAFLAAVSSPALLPARPALAQSSDAAAARAMFEEGRKLVKAGKYAEACPKFEESLKLDRGVGTQFNLADCWERLGRTASAWALFLDVAAVTKAAGQADRERAARDRAAALEPKLPARPKSRPGPPRWRYPPHRKRSV